jgi:site-specific DNA-methyltransferase (adenine-specific)
MARKSKNCRAGASPAKEERQAERLPYKYPESPERIYHDLGVVNPVAGIVMDKDAIAPLNLVYEDDAHGIYLYQGDCLEVLDAIAAKHPDGCFDAIFADPPYFLSNGGITCHAGKMVSVHKGDWDSLAKSFGASKSSGAMEMMHEFNTEWLRRCQRVLKPNGTIWVTGTHHVIFSVGYAMQQLGFKILNDIAWEKPNPPPNLSCRYFTHSTETVLWATKTEKSKHRFNYRAMKAVTGKQMKTVWTMPAPGKAEKQFGKHPTQKPVVLLERCVLASTNAGDLVLDPFLGGGTSAIACVRTQRHFVGIELDITHLLLACKRADREVIAIWLREFRVRIDVSVVGRVTRHGESEAPREVTRPTRNDPNDLDLFRNLIDPINAMPDKPDIAAESIFHETKFVFLSCAQARTGSVVHTVVDADVKSAWSHTPQSVKLQTTHIVRCETEILRVRIS